MRRIRDQRLARHLLVITVLKLAALAVLWLLFFRQPVAPDGAVCDAMLRDGASAVHSRSTRCCGDFSTAR